MPLGNLKINLFQFKGESNKWIDIKYRYIIYRY